MKRHEFLGQADYSHASGECTGVLVTNLGTPDAATPSAVRRYLAQFLSDPRVIEMSRWLWLPILHGVILRIRPSRSAAAYRKVWTESGSPLLDFSKRQAQALQVELSTRASRPVRVALGMRYGNPSIPSALETLRNAGARRIVVLPLYPQYSATTTASTYDEIFASLAKWRWLPALRTITNYHDEPGYILALADSIRSDWAKTGTPERLLFSFHGIPKRYVLAGDPYFCHCQKTARLVAEKLELAPEQWTVSFQSRVGREEWLKPYTDHLLKEWGANGVRAVSVVCAGFSADCLETLEEIAVENNDYFIQAGGERLSYVPALNDAQAHMRFLADLVTMSDRDWWQQEQSDAEIESLASARQARARAHGASA